VNASLYSGDVDYLDLTGTASQFWSLDVHGALTRWRFTTLNTNKLDVAISVQGHAVSVTSSTKLAVFDTATTIIAGPPADVKAIWAAVPGSTPSTSQDGFYQFCAYVLCILGGS
jgi:cathepsin D